jgi:hypothetical protein
LIIRIGLYSFGRKTTAYRNDFCLSCAAPRLAYQARTFDVIHVFYIPLIPVGFWRRWHCSVCDHDPHVHPGTLRAYKWAAVVLLAIFAVIAWMAAPEGDPLRWPLRLGLPLASAALVWHTLRSKPDLRLADKLMEIRPADETVCPQCGGPLILDAVWRCSVCGIKRAVVRG